MALSETTVLYALPVHEKAETLIQDRNFEPSDIDPLNAILEEELYRYESVMRRANISQAVTSGGNNKIDSAYWATLRDSGGGGEWVPDTYSRLNDVLHNLPRDPFAIFLLATVSLGLVVVLFCLLWIKVSPTVKHQRQGWGYPWKSRQKFSAFSPSNLPKGAYYCLKLILSTARNMHPMRRFVRTCIHLRNVVYSVVSLVLVSIKTMVSLGTSVPGKLIDSVVSNNGQASDLPGGFDPKYYYNDLRYLIHCVNKQIKSRRTINDEAIMDPVKDRYRSCDMLTCLSSCVKLQDEKLKKLTDRFVENAVRYGSSFYVPLNYAVEPGDSKIEWREDNEAMAKCQTLSDELTRTMTERIEHLLRK
jgi:hypothetical protein